MEHRERNVTVRQPQRFMLDKRRKRLGLENPYGASCNLIHRFNKPAREHDNPRTRSDLPVDSLRRRESQPAAAAACSSGFGLIGKPFFKSRPSCTLIFESRLGLDHVFVSTTKIPCGAITT